jgi:hypothetical protein
MGKYSTVRLWPLSDMTASDPKETSPKQEPRPIYLVLIVQSDRLQVEP